MTTLAEIEQMCRAVDPALPIEFRQTNSEAQLVDWVQEAIDAAAGIVINPAAYSFTSLALVDALKMFEGPIVEVHLSNIHRREPMYQRSLVSTVASAVMAGFGPRGYRLAVQAIGEMVRGQR
jgi:3-dehydroquinate dehydratase-2